MDRLRNTRQPDWEWWSELWPNPESVLKKLGIEADEALVDIGSGMAISPFQRLSSLLLLPSMLSISTPTCLPSSARPLRTWASRISSVSKVTRVYWSHCFLNRLISFSLQIPSTVLRSQQPSQHRPTSHSHLTVVSSSSTGMTGQRKRHLSPVDRAARPRSFG